MGTFLSYGTKYLRRNRKSFKCSIDFVRISRNFGKSSCSWHIMHFIIQIQILCLRTTFVNIWNWNILQIKSSFFLVVSLCCAQNQLCIILKFQMLPLQSVLYLSTSAKSGKFVPTVLWYEPKTFHSNVNMSKVHVSDVSMSPSVTKKVVPCIHPLILENRVWGSAESCRKLYSTTLKVI